MSRHRTHTLVLFAIGFAAIAGWLTFGENRPGNAGQAPPAAAPVATPGAQKAPVVVGERKADYDAIMKALDNFSDAFQKGDAKAVAALWTPDGEYISDDGTTFAGRAALEKAYTEFFSKNPNNSLDVEVNSVRFPSRDNAVVEAYCKLHKGKKKELVVSKCSFLYTREDGKWLITIAREWPGDGLELRDLEWLIGSWEVKRDGTTVNTKYEWTANKSFIRCNFSVTQDGKTTTGMQMIGKDPATGLLRSWTFEDEGGIAETDITRDGKKWLFTANGSTSEGKVLTAVNILTPVDHDAFLWQSVDRTLDDDDLPDLPQVKVTRVKTK